MDNVNKATRSKMMRAVKSRWTSPEMAVRAFLRLRGARFLDHVNGMPGSPDFFMPDYPAAVEVLGCFWHGHSGCFVGPKTNRGFWRRKVSGNMTRDAKNARRWRRRRIPVLGIWECSLREKPGEILELLLCLTAA